MRKIKFRIKDGVHVDITRRRYIGTILKEYINAYDVEIIGGGFCRVMKEDVDVVYIKEV